MKILIPVDGSANAQRAVDYVIKNIAALKETPQLLLLNVQWNVAAGNVKLFINQETINDYYREQGMAALQTARAQVDAQRQTIEAQRQTVAGQRHGIEAARKRCRPE